MSARAYHRILKAARTIADLAGSEGIETVHLAARFAALRGASQGDPVSAEKANVSPRHSVAVPGHNRNRPKSGLIFEAKCDMMAGVEGMS